MSGRLVNDELWAEFETLFPSYERSPMGGRSPVENRVVFTCPVILLKTGMGWRDMASELGACERSVRQRLKEWSEQGLWSKIFYPLLAKLNAVP